MADIFDAEINTEQKPPGIFCTLPMVFFGLGDVQVRLSATPTQSSIQVLNSDREVLKSKQLIGPSISADDSLYKLIEALYTKLGKEINSSKH